MKQPIEVIKFSQYALSNISHTREGLLRVAGHAKRARSSFWKGLKNPVLHTEAAAERLTDVETAIERLFTALDDARIQLVLDTDHYLARIKEATRDAQIEIAAPETK